MKLEKADEHAGPKTLSGPSGSNYDPAKYMPKLWVGKGLLYFHQL